MKTKQAGFTLVEIAIVLVIIGLLLGGVLKGQELITQAKIKNVVNDLNGISAAFYAYQDRYKALPGDDKNAASRWGTGVTSGDGNGQIGGDFLEVGKETEYLWIHLRKSGLISGDPAATGASAFPQNAEGGFTGIRSGGFSTSSGGSTTSTQLSHVVCTSNLPSKIAAAIDAQLDDGLPGSGTIQAAKQSSLMPNGTALSAIGTYSPAATPAPVYTDQGGELYTICKTI